MFPLKTKQLIRGCAKHQSQSGLGCAADYVADGDELLLPFDGTIQIYSGVQGGNWLRLIRDDNGDWIEFAHLDRYKVSPGHYEAGKVVAITGNTGRISSGPHLHVQIFRNGVRLDPETYEWHNEDMSVIEALKDQVRRLHTRIDELTTEALRWKEERFKWYNIANEWKTKSNQWETLNTQKQDEIERKERVIQEQQEELEQLRNAQNLHEQYGDQRVEEYKKGLVARFLEFLNGSK